MVRCSKARAMFAMRACRKSVMVGMPLTQQQMTSVSYPTWNCHDTLSLKFFASRWCAIWEPWINLGIVLMGDLR